jgi:predicted nucleic acid-binding protein
VLALDNSAWSRIVAVELPSDRAEAVADWIERRRLATCLPFLLEAGFSARTHTDHKAMMGQFDLFPRLALTPTAEERAREAQGRLAAVGRHRMAPIDIMIAACAHEAGAGVLHYDRDYDLIAEHTSLTFESVWLAPAGSL